MKMEIANKDEVISNMKKKLKHLEVLKIELSQKGPTDDDKDLSAEQKAE